MAKFRYNATDARGRWVSGEAEGESLQAVQDRLMAEGLDVSSMVEAEGDRVTRTSDRDAREFVEQLHGLTRSGLPLPSGLRAAAQEVDSADLRVTFEDLARQVEAGIGLDHALQAKGDRFPAHLWGLILAGARSGRLSEVLGESVQNANLAAELRRRFWSVVAYPAISAVLVAILVVCICHLSVQASDAMLQGLNSFGSPQNAQGEALVIMARWVSDHWLKALILATIFGATTLLMIRFAMTPARRRRLACGIPVLGPVLRFTSLSEFCRLLAMLLEAETPLPEALQLAGRSVQDAEVAEACDRMARAIFDGEPLSAAFRLWDSVPAGLGQLFRWSEKQQALPEALRMAGEMFEARARSQSAFAANVLSTFLALLILWWVGFALATLYLPLISLIRLLSSLA